MNKIRIKIKTLFHKLIYSFTIFAVGSSVAFADFILMNKSEYQSQEPYGNAELVCFRNAMTGRPLTEAEERALAGTLPLRETDRFYGRFRANASNLVLDDIRNRSTPVFINGVLVPSINQRRLVTKRRGTRSQIGLEVAIGYVWDNEFRADLEYLINRNFNYFSSPVLGGSPVQSLDTEIKSNPLLVNAYYDFSGFDRFRPYVVGAIGVSANTIKTTINPVPPFPNTGQSTKRIASFAWALGAGFRVSVFTRWFVDISYRYIRLGTNIPLQPGDTTFKLNGNYSMNAVSFGLIYIF